MSTKLDNAYLAQELLGCAVIYGGNTEPFDRCGCEDNTHSEYDMVSEKYYRIKNYFTSRTAIWQVIDAMERKGFRMYVASAIDAVPYEVTFKQVRNNTDASVEYANTASNFNVAVCNAALLYLDSQETNETNI